MPIIILSLNSVCHALANILRNIFNYTCHSYIPFNVKLIGLPNSGLIIAKYVLLRSFANLVKIRK